MYVKLISGKQVSIYDCTCVHIHPNMADPEKVLIETNTDGRPGSFIDRTVTKGECEVYVMDNVGHTVDRLL